MADPPAVPDPVEPLQDAERVSAITRLHELVRDGHLGLERFSSALEQVLAARSQDDVEAAMAGVPSLVRLTPASRRLQDGLTVDVGIRRLELGAGWQVAPMTSITTSTGRCHVDLTEASWDAPVIELHLETATGRIEVVVPAGVAVQVLSARGRIELESLAPPIPGGPLLRVVAAATTGRIVIRNPRPRRRHFRRRHRRVPN